MYFTTIAEFPHPNRNGKKGTIVAGIRPPDDENAPTQHGLPPCRRPAEIAATSISAADTDVTSLLWAVRTLSRRERETLALSAHATTAPGRPIGGMAA